MRARVQRRFDPRSSSVEACCEGGCIARADGVFTNRWSERSYAERGDLPVQPESGFVHGEGRVHASGAHLAAVWPSWAIQCFPSDTNRVP
jgi:hypothetical protein